jgi:hypothetical protein
MRSLTGCSAFIMAKVAEQLDEIRDALRPEQAEVSRISAD